MTHPTDPEPRAPTVTLATLVAAGVLSWPLGLVQAGLVVAGLVSYARTSETVAVVGPVLALAGAGVTTWLCRAGRTGFVAFGVAGISSAWLAAGLALGVHEVMHHAHGALAECVQLGARSFVVGAVGAGILSIPAGLVFGIIVACLARLVGVREPPWFGARPGLRRAVAVALMLVQIVAGVGLAYSLHGWQEGRF